MQHALNQVGITFHTPEILRSTAAAKLVETFVRELGIRIEIPFYLALALRDLTIRKFHPPLLITIISNHVEVLLSVLPYLLLFVSANGSCDFLLIKA